MLDGVQIPMGRVRVVKKLQFGFGSLLLFDVLVIFETMATTLTDLRRLFAGNSFCPIVAKSVDSNKVLCCIPKSAHNMMRLPYRKKHVLTAEFSFCGSYFRAR